MDLSATGPINDMFTLQAQYASFDSDSDRYADTDKFRFAAQLKL